MIMIRNVDAVVFVYDVNDVSTLMSLDSWVDEVDDHGVGDHVPRVLVGNKCDETDQGGVVTTTGTAQRWADDRGMPVFETSAKDDTNCDHVDGIFLTLAHKLVAGKTLTTPVSSEDGSNGAVRLLYQSRIAAPPQEQESDSCCF